MKNKIINESIFKIKLSKSIFTSIVYVILLIIPDLLIYVISIYVFRIGSEYFDMYIAGGIIGNIAVNSILILISFILKKPLRKLIDYNLSTNKKIIIISLLILFSIAIFFYKFIKNNSFFSIYI